MGRMIRQREDAAAPVSKSLGVLPANAASTLSRPRYTHLRPRFDGPGAQMGKQEHAGKHTVFRADVRFSVVHIEPCGSNPPGSQPADRCVIIDQAAACSTDASHTIDA
jgi:hypothetical protein